VNYPLVTSLLSNLNKHWASPLEAFANVALASVGTANAAGEIEQIVGQAKIFPLYIHKFRNNQPTRTHQEVMAFF